MTLYLILFAPFLLIGGGVALAPFLSHSWPDWLVSFVAFCAEMGNGIWVAGIAIALLMSIGIPLPAAVVMSWPVMFFAGRYFARLSEDWDAQSRRIKREAWERHEKEQRSGRS